MKDRINSAAQDGITTDGIYGVWGNDDSDVLSDDGLLFVFHDKVDVIIKVKIGVSHIKLAVKRGNGTWKKTSEIG